jgi:hypothetical protein
MTELCKITIEITNELPFLSHMFNYLRLKHGFLVLCIPQHVGIEALSTKKNPLPVIPYSAINSYVLLSSIKNSSQNTTGPPVHRNTCTQNTETVSYRPYRRCGYLDEVTKESLKHCASGNCVYMCHSVSALNCITYKCPDY